MVWVLLVLAGVSWVVVSLIRVGEGDAAMPGGSGTGTRLPVAKKGPSTSARLAPTLVEVWGTARTRLGPAARTFGRNLVRDGRVAFAVAADGLRGLGRAGARAGTLTAEAFRRRQLAGSTYPARRRCRGEMTRRAARYEVTERPWLTRMSSTVQLAMLVAIGAVLVAGAVTLAALVVAQLITS
jgi:hypothetical protein